MKVKPDSFVESSIADKNKWEKIKMTEAEREFNRNRLMWAFVDGELYWTYSENGHREWLDKTFGTDYAFADTLRGYIRKDMDKNMVYIVAYKGDFNNALISNAQIKLLVWLASLNYSYNKIEIYSGVEKGKPGEIWKTKQLIKEIPRDTLNNRLVAMIDLLTYEKFIVNLLNRDDKHLSERITIKDEYRDLLALLRGYYNMKVTTSNALIRRTYLYAN